MQLINKNNIAVKEAASKDFTRYVLQSVYFDETGSIATNGRILVKCSYPENFLIEDFPETTDLTRESCLPAIVPLKPLEKVLKNIPKNGNMPILHNAILEKSKKQGNHEKVEFITTDLDTTDKVESLVVEGGYPKYENVIPKEDPTLEVNFSLEILETLVSTLKKMNLKEKSSLSFKFIDPITAVRVKTETEEGQEILAVMMPMRKN